MPAVSGQPQGRAGSTTIVQAPYGTQVSKPTVLSRALIATRKVLFTAKDLADPERLYQVVYQIQQGVTTAIHALASSPLSLGSNLRNNVYTAGQTLYLNHGLGRAYSGWFVTRVQGTSAGTAAYGVVYNVPADNLTLTMTLVSTFYVIPAAHAGLTSGTTLTTGSSASITVTASGIYTVMWSGTVNPSVSPTFVAIFVNGSERNEIQMQPFPNGAVAPVSMSGVLSLNAGDVVDVRAENTSGGGNTLTVNSSNLSVYAAPGPAEAITEATLPTGVTSDKQIGLTSVTAGTFDFFVY